MIIGIIVYLVLNYPAYGPISESVIYNSMKECTDGLQVANDKAAEVGVKIVFSKCFQEH